MVRPADNLGKLLASAINGWLGLDPDARSRLPQLDGKLIAIHLKVIDVTMTLRIDHDRVSISNDPEAEPNTVLHGTPLGMARLGLGQDTAGTLFSGAVEITGDVETGQAFKAILDDMDIDWEEQLSHLTGDVIAHQVGNAAHKATGWLQHSRSTLERNLGEYLQEELRVLPARIEIENLIADISDMAMAVDRLQARLQRLQHRRQTP